MVTLNQQWKPIRKALGRFEYFQNYTEEQVRSMNKGVKESDLVSGDAFQIIQCCSLAQIKQYNPNDVIYAVDRGRLNSVYFVLSGNCTILQTLKLMVWLSINQPHFCNYSHFFKFI